MGKKIFVSYKYGDDQVENHFHTTKIQQCEITLQNLRIY